MGKNYKTGDQTGNWETYLTCPVCGWSGIVYYTTKEPTYCSDACRQKAYRQRKRENVTPEKNEGVTNFVARDKHGVYFQHEEYGRIDLVEMRCSCGRGIFTVPGNRQIGGIRCDLCKGEFQ
jgi:hypothetical protein